MPQFATPALVFGCCTCSRFWFRVCCEHKHAHWNKFLFEHRWPWPLGRHAHLTARWDTRSCGSGAFLCSGLYCVKKKCEHSIRVTLCANTEISTGGMMPEASSLHFNILSAVICSPRLTYYASLSLLTLPFNSLKSSTSNLLYITPHVLTSNFPRAPGLYLEPQLVWGRDASLWNAPLTPFFIY